jgi:hypothetical protein
MATFKRLKVIAHIDNTIVEKFLFECVTHPINKGYRNSFIASCASLLRVYLRSRSARPNVPLQESPVLCFYAFDNEMSAINQALSINPEWRACRLDHISLTGIDWRKALAPAPMLILPFIRTVVAVGGIRAIRNFAMPFIGYLLYQHLRRIFAKMQNNPAILISNLVHPLSVAAHLAAIKCGLRTIFWEHAVTPRILISIAREFDECYVKQEYTRQAYIDNGIPEKRVKIINREKVMKAVMLTRAPQLIGLCVNDMDLISETFTLMQMLVDAQFKVVLRVHKTDRRIKKIKNMAIKSRVPFSEATQESIADFFRNVDLIIVGNSNVLYDCLSAKKSIVYFWPGEEKLFDYLGMVSAYKLMSFTSAKQILNYLDQLKEG